MRVVFFPCVSSERRDTARRQHQQKHAPQKGRRDHRRRRRGRLHSKRAADDDGKEMNQSVNQARERKALCKCRHSISVFSLRLSRILKASLSLFSPLRVRLEPSSSLGERRQHRVVVLVAEGRGAKLKEKREVF